MSAEALPLPGAGPTALAGGGPVVEASSTRAIGSGWRAELELRFAPSAGGDTRLVRRRHMGPLVVQRPFYPEGPQVPHVYVLHPPGGLVGGDQLRLDVTAEPGARSLITTPAATKVYRSGGPLASQSFSFHVGDGATTSPDDSTAAAAIEWLPQETILHDGADVELCTAVSLSRHAGFIGMETLCFGLPARGETFATGRCRQRFEIWREDRPLFIERGRFDAGDAVHKASWGLGSARVSGLLVMVPVGPLDEPALLARLRAAAADFDGSSSSSVTERAGVTVLGDGAGEVWVCRYLGPSAERSRMLFQSLWTLARPAILGRAAVPPRIWAT